MFDFLFRKRKDNENNQLDREIEYRFDLVEKMSNLYTIDFKGMKQKDYRYLQYALINGHCGIIKRGDEFLCGMGSYCGELDIDGVGKRYLITFLNGETYEGEIGKDIVILKWNNIERGRIRFIEWFADMLAKTDVSINYNILYTRVCPIPIVDNDIEKKSLEEVLKNLFNGVTKIFKRTTAQGFFDNGDTRRERTLDITNPQASIYMQNLSRFHDELILRFCLENGVYVSARDKGAQLNETELNSFKDYCTISADDTYNRLLDFADDMKKVFDVDVTITQKAFVYTEKDVEKDENETTENVDNNVDNVDNNVSRETSEGEGDENGID